MAVVKIATFNSSESNTKFMNLGTTELNAIFIRPIGDCTRLGGPYHIKLATKNGLTYL
jgi:hypothetical protein